MNTWLVSGIVMLLLIGGGIFYFQGYGSTVLDPYALVSVPPPPELPADAKSTETSFVPTSGKFLQEASVSSNNGQTSSVSEVCTGGASTDFYCYEEHYLNLVDEEGISAAFADLKVRYQSNPYVVAQCHPLTHVIGRGAAYKFETPGEAYTHGDGFCWSGYYHGILETFLDEIGRKNLPQELDRICDGIEGKESYSFDYYNCVHGLGHGVMAITQNELFESLDYCDLLTGRWEQESCASGVYMENVIVDGLNHFTKYLDPARPLYPCTESPEKYKNTCYLMQTSYILKVNGGDFRDTFAWCRKAEEPYRATCLQSLGRDASGRTSSDIEETKRTCLLGENFFEHSNCVIGAVKDIISYFHSDVEAKQFCALLSSEGGDEELTSLCDSTTISYYAQF